MAESASSEEQMGAASAGLPPASPEPVPLVYAAPYPAPPPAVVANRTYVSEQLMAGADPAALGLRPPAQATTQQPSPGRPAPEALPAAGVESSRGPAREVEPGPSGY